MAQRADTELRVVIGWLENSSTRPSWNQVQAVGEEAKEYWTQWEMLDLKGGVLYRRWLSSDGLMRWFQLIPPPELREEIMRRAHQEATGHLGVRKTLEQVRRRAFWKSWRRDVERYCRRCTECCRYHRGGAPRQGRLQDMVIGSPGERVGMDLTGLHPRSRRGHHYMHTYIDHFTKFAEAYPLLNKEAETVVGY